MPPRRTIKRKFNKKLTNKKVTLGTYRNFRYKNPTHYFKRTCNVGNLVNFSVNGNAVRSTNALLIYNSGIGAIEYASYSCYATLDALPDYTEFTSLFDRYQIVGMKLNFIQYATNAATGAALGAQYGQSGVIWHGINDYDDAGVPAASDAGLQTLRCYESYKTRNVFDPRKGLTIKQYVRPRIAMAAYGGGVFSRYANEKPQWIDAASTDVQHFGFKGMFEISPSNSAGTTINIWIKPELTLYIKCKDVR